MYQSWIYSCKLVYLSFLLSFLTSMLMLYCWEWQISCRRCSKLLTSSVVASDVALKCQLCRFEHSWMHCCYLGFAWHDWKKPKQSYCAGFFFLFGKKKSLLRHSRAQLFCCSGLYQLGIVWLGDFGREWVDAYVPSTCSPQTCSCMEKLNSQLQN
jgi:hypothetical protein